MDIPTTNYSHSLPEDLWRFVQHPIDTSALEDYLARGGSIDAVDGNLSDGEVWCTTLLMYSVCSFTPTANFFLLLEKGGGSLVDVQDSWGSTALHVCARFGNAGSMEILLKDYYANPNIQNKSGETPLHEAAHYNKVECLKLLMWHGGDISLKNINGKTALDILRDENIDEDIILQIESYASEVESMNVKEPAV